MKGLLLFIVCTFANPLDWLNNATLLGKIGPIEPNINFDASLTLTSSNIVFKSDNFFSNVPLQIPWSPQYDALNIAKRTYHQALKHQKALFRTHVLSILYGVTENLVFIDIPSHITREVAYAIATELNIAGFLAYIRDGDVLTVRVPLPKLY